MSVLQLASSADYTGRSIVELTAATHYVNDIQCIVSKAVR